MEGKKEKNNKETIRIEIVQDVMKTKQCQK